MQFFTMARDIEIVWKIFSTNAQDLEIFKIIFLTMTKKFDFFFNFLHYCPRLENLSKGNISSSLCFYHDFFQ